METLVIIRQNNYWGSGKDVEEAKANYRKSSGRPATNLADVSTFQGSQADLERITIDDVDGTIMYPRAVVKAK